MEEQNDGTLRITIWPMDYGEYSSFLGIYEQSFLHEITSYGHRSILAFYTVKKATSQGGGSDLKNSSTFTF